MAMAVRNLLKRRLYIPSQPGPATAEAIRHFAKFGKVENNPFLAFSPRGSKRVVEPSIGAPKPPRTLSRPSPIVTELASPTRLKAKSALGLSLLGLDPPAKAPPTSDNTTGLRDGGDRKRDDADQAGWALDPSKHPDTPRPALPNTEGRRSSSKIGNTLRRRRTSLARPPANNGCNPLPLPPTPVASRRPALPPLNFNSKADTERPVSPASVVRPPKGVANDPAVSGVRKPVLQVVPSAAPPRSLSPFAESGDVSEPEVETTEENGSHGSASRA
jgi:hypothetical protein